MISAVLGFSFLKIYYSTKTYIVRDLSTVVMTQNAQNQINELKEEIENLISQMADGPKKAEFQNELDKIIRMGK